MNIFEKIKLLFKKPKIIIVAGEGRSCAKEAIFQVLKPYFKIEQGVLIFETDLTPHQTWWAAEKLKFLIKHSSLPILVVTHVGDIPFDKPSQVLSNKIWEGKDFFAGEIEKTIEIRKLAKSLPSRGYLILNFDDETVREIKDETNLRELSFGFQEGADFQATDIKLNNGTNFKINYKGSIVPVWLAPTPKFGVGVGKEQIYSALAATAVGTIFGLNLVEISQALKNYYSLPAEQPKKE